MSSSSWGSPENIEVEDYSERCDVTPGPSALEAVQIYGSPTFVNSPAASVDFSVLSYVTSTAEEDDFLYGSSSLLQDEPLKNSQIETKKPPSLEWSDEEDCSLSSLNVSNSPRELNSNSSKNVLKCDSYDEEEESKLKVDLDESNIAHDKPKSSLNEIPQTSGMQNENDKQQKVLQRRWDQKIKPKKEPTRYPPFECHSILSAIKKSNESESRNARSLSENQKNSGAVEEKVNTNNVSSQKPESANSRGYVAPQRINEQRTEVSSDLRENENLSRAASLISAFLSEAKAKSSGCTSEPSSERTILLKHLKTSSQTEKLVLKTCDKTSKTITNYRPSPKALSKDTLATLNKYLTDFSKNPNDTQNAHLQEAKGSSLHESFEGGDRYKPFTVACTSSKSGNLPSSHQPSVPSAIPYKDVGRSRRSRSRSRNSEYRGHHSRDRTFNRRSSDRTPRSRSRDRTPRRRSRDRTPTRRRSRDRTPRRRSRDTRYSYAQNRRRDDSRDRSNSYDRNSRRRSRDRNSRERNSKYEPYLERPERSRSRHRSPFYNRRRSSRSRSRDRSRRPTYRKLEDRTTDSRYRRSESSEERGRRCRVSPSHSYFKTHRSPSRESTDSSFSSLDTICLEK